MRTWRLPVARDRPGRLTDLTERLFQDLSQAVEATASPKSDARLPAMILDPLREPSTCTTRLYSYVSRWRSYSASQF